MNTHIFLQTSARLLAETAEPAKACSCCGRRDHDPPPLSPEPSPRALPRLGREFKSLGELSFNLLNNLMLRGAAVVAPARDRRALRRAK